MERLGRLILVVLATLSIGCLAAEDRSFEIEKDQFLKDGKPFRIISGRHVTALGSAFLLM